MSVILHIHSAFDKFPDEAGTIGRLVTEYGVLEYDYCLMVGALIQDRNAAIKTMYRVRSEAQRLAVGDALARSQVTVERLSIYESIIADLHICRKIRNLYAHAQWVEATGPRLAFVDLDSLARSNCHVSEAEQDLYEITIGLLSNQARFYHQVDQNIRYFNDETQMINGEREAGDVHYVIPTSRPKEKVRLTP